MKRKNIVNTKFSEEEIKQIGKAVEHYNKFVKIGKTNRSELMRTSILDLSEKILASKKITMRFED